MRNFLIFLLISISIGCVRGGKEGPSVVDLIRQYTLTSYSVDAAHKRSVLMEMTTGDLRLYVEGLSDRDFAVFFQDQSRTLKNIAIRENKNLREDEAQLTYELTLTQTLKDQKAVTITQRKLALLKKIPQGWKIAQIRNLSETTEFSGEMVFK